MVEAQRGLPAGAVCGTRTQPAGTGVQMHLLELETAGQFECGMKPDAPNVSGPVGTGQNRSGQTLVTSAADTILPC